MNNKLKRLMPLFILKGYRKMNDMEEQLDSINRNTSNNNNRSSSYYRDTYYAKRNNKK